MFWIVLIFLGSSDSLEVAKPLRSIISLEKGKMIRLEKFGKEFYADLISWIDSEKTLMQFAGPEFNFPLTNEQLDKSLSDKNRYAFRVVNTNTNRSIGYAEIYLTENLVYFGRILIGDRKQRGKQIGQRILNLLLDFTFSNLNRTKVELNVFDWNLQAIKCYEKVGFVINQDRKVERIINNEIWTTISMTMDKATWQEFQIDKIKML